MNEPKKTLVEGLKVEEGAVAAKCAKCGHDELDHYSDDEHSSYCLKRDPDSASFVPQACPCPGFTQAAQHLKREQERRCTCVVMTPRNIYPGGRHLDDSCPVHTIQPREQEPAPGELGIVGNFPCECPEPYLGAQIAGTPLRCERCRGLVNRAAQPPQELVSLRKQIEEFRRLKNSGCTMGDWEAIGYCRACDDILAALTRGAVGK